MCVQFLAIQVVVTQSNGMREVNAWSSRVDTWTWPVLY